MIKVYSRSNDPYSDMLKNLLKFYQVSYENIEVSRNKEALKEMIEISGQSTTPVIVMNDKVFIGFDRQKIKEILGLPEDQTQ